VRTVNIGTRDVSTTDFGLPPETAAALFGWGFDAATSFFSSDSASDYLSGFSPG